MEGADAASLAQSAFLHRPVHSRSGGTGDPRDVFRRERPERSREKCRLARHGVPAELHDHRSDIWRAGRPLFAVGDHRLRRCGIQPRQPGKRVGAGFWIPRPDAGVRGYWRSGVRACRPDHPRGSLPDRTPRHDLRVVPRGDPGGKRAGLCFWRGDEFLFWMARAVSFRGHSRTAARGGVFVLQGSPATGEGRRGHTLACATISGSSRFRHSSSTWALRRR